MFDRQKGTFDPRYNMIVKHPTRNNPYCLGQEHLTYLFLAINIKTYEYRFLVHRYDTWYGMKHKVSSYFALRRDLLHYTESGDDR